MILSEKPRLPLLVDQTVAWEQNHSVKHVVFLNADFPLLGIPIWKKTKTKQIKEAWGRGLVYDFYK